MAQQVTSPATSYSTYQKCEDGKNEVKEKLKPRLTWCIPVFDRHSRFRYNAPGEEQTLNSGISAKC